MNENNVNELKEEIRELCSKIFKKLTEDNDNYEDLIASWMELHTVFLESVNSNLHELAEKEFNEDEIMDKIEAHSAVIEVKDKNTGLLFRRYIPIDYLETDNGIIISGETLSGTVSEIAFLSDLALSRIKDLRGMGPEKDSCGSH
ncbi:MAG: hypothetical protein GXY91_08790 [Clostridia bacterium]|nr:hypothetical protein [Clostridia bacterium]